MKNPFTNLFIFTKSERNGVLGLTILILLVIGVRYGLESNYLSESYDYSNFEKQIIALKSHQDTMVHYQSGLPNFSGGSNTKRDEFLNSKTSSIPTYSIDPNNASLEDWEQLGFSKKQAEVILNYKAKGAVFRKKNDLLKLFVIDEKKLSEISEFVKISPDLIDKKKEVPSKKETYAKTNKSVYPKKEHIQPRSININKADTTSLKRIRGIGSYYAKSIVKYREMVGGIYDESQFGEIYGVQDKPAVMDSLKKYVRIDREAINKININQCTVKELSKHYYIKWSMAKAIVSYREMHGPFKNVEDIGRSDLVSDDLVSKIVPYLKLNDD